MIPNYLKTVYDEYNDREVVFSNADLKAIIDIRNGKFPPGFNPYREYVDYVKHDARFPLTGNMTQKKDFLPNKDEEKYH